MSSMCMNFGKNIYVPFAIVDTRQCSVYICVDTKLFISHFWLGIQTTATVIILLKQYVPLIAVPADLQWHGTCSGHRKRSPWSEAVAGQVSEPASNSPGASHPAGFPPRPLLSCSPSPCPGQPSCPGEEHLNKLYLIRTRSHNWNKFKIDSKRKGTDIYILFRMFCAWKF